MLLKCLKLRLSWKISNKVVIMLHNTKISFKRHDKNLIYSLIWNGNVLKIVPIIARFSTKAFDFLAGLNKELDEVWDRILGKEPMPSIREIFTEVRRKNSRRKVMLGEQQSDQFETFAFIIHGGETFQLSDQRPGKRGYRPWRDHCRKWGHTRG